MHLCILHIWEIVSPIQLRLSMLRWRPWIVGTALHRIIYPSSYVRECHCWVDLHWISDIQVYFVYALPLHCVTYTTCGYRVASCVMSVCVMFLCVLAPMSQLMELIMRPLSDCVAPSLFIVFRNADRFDAKSCWMCCSCINVVCVHCAAVTPARGSVSELAGGLTLLMARTIYCWG